MKRALFVGRFQPFHYGHLDMVEHILNDKNIDELIIGIGSAQDSHTLNNPFTAGERYEMIYESIKHLNQGVKYSNDMTMFNMITVHKKPIYIIPIPDNPSNTAWVSTIKSYVPRFDYVYTNEPLSCRLFKEAGYEVRGYMMLDRRYYAGTYIRGLIMNNGSVFNIPTGTWIVGHNWEKLVPEGTTKIIKEIDGINRLVELNKSDKL